MKFLIKNNFSKIVFAVIEIYKWNNDCLRWKQKNLVVKDMFFFFFFTKKYFQFQK